MAILQWDHVHGFHLDGIDANRFRDRWGLIHARKMHPSFYDPERFRPSRTGIDYLTPIFTNCLGHDDAEAMRIGLFDSGNLTRPYHSVNADIGRRIRYLD